MTCVVRMPKTLRTSGVSRTAVPEPTVTYMQDTEKPMNAAPSVLSTVKAIPAEMKELVKSVENGNANAVLGGKERNTDDG